MYVNGLNPFRDYEIFGEIQFGGKLEGGRDGFAQHKVYVILNCLVVFDYNVGNAVVVAGGFGGEVVAFVDVDVGSDARVGRGVDFKAKEGAPALV